MIIWYRTRCFKNCFQKVVYKTDEFIGNKIASAVTKLNEDKIVNLFKKIIIPVEKVNEILNDLRQELLQRWNTIKYLSY